MTKKSGKTVRPKIKQSSGSSKKYRSLSVEEKREVASKIDNEGFDYYVNAGGWAKEDFEGTAIEEYITRYKQAHEELVEEMRRIGIDPESPYDSACFEGEDEDPDDEE